MERGGRRVGTGSGEEAGAPGGSIVVATEMDLVASHRVAFYQAGRLTDREWRGSGSVLKAHIIGWAIAEGHEEFDFLRGDEAYKSDWASQRRELVRVRFGIGPVGRAVGPRGPLVASAGTDRGVDPASAWPGAPTARDQPRSLVTNDITSSRAGR